MVFTGLFVILIIVLGAPFLVKKVEEQLEVFLFVMGCLAVTITSQWSGHLIKEALVEPIKITMAVLVAGFVFMKLQKPFSSQVNRLVELLGTKLFVFLVVVALGIFASVITAIISAIILVAIISGLTLSRKNEILFVVISCFSIGLGAALTPIGEPLSTIVVAKLRDAPYQADFFFLLKHLWLYVLPGIFALGIVGAIVVPGQHGQQSTLTENEAESLHSVWSRTGKVYLFVMALVFLGQGFKPIIDAYIVKIPYQGLYWLNTVSAILDNATLAAAEIGPSMGLLQIKSALIALLLSGGMLIPGNIPNIISAGKLKITSTEWALVGVPLGLVLLGIYFVLMLAFN